MGGDNAPQAAVTGALLAAAQDAELRILLIGREDEVHPVIAQYAESEKRSGSGRRTADQLQSILQRVTVAHASEVIETQDQPTTAIRQKKDSSLVIGLHTVKHKQADAFVSAGNTGALLTGATVIIGRSDGVERPALGTLLPNLLGHTLLIDSGANMDAKPSYLAQFAQMGSAYVRRTMGIESPRVGLINVGMEKEKGNALVKEALPLLEAQADINFIGFVEANAIPAGEVDVAVCDAFVGNVVLKYTEGFAKAMMTMIKEELTAKTMSKLGALMSTSAYARLKKRFDYREVGGAPFLGLKSLVIKAHGSSDATAIANAIRCAVTFAAAGDVVKKEDVTETAEGLLENKKEENNK
jgi:glycerol-3-phosphate acyltransferase PlsX